MSGAPGTPPLVRAEDLAALAAGLFRHAGVNEADAALWARGLVWANLRGVDSHGLLRIPRYLSLLANGGIRADADMKVLVSAGAIALLDADLVPGPVGMGRAMDLALERAREVHAGCCVARNITHAGAVGMYALRAAEAGMAGLVMTASKPLMAYHGSRDSVLSTNPIAIAIPAGKHAPLVLDMSTATATVAMGKIQQAKHVGKPIPEGWGLGAAGNPTTNAEAVETLTPMAGPKGSGLSLMIECLASLVAGNPIIAPALSGVAPESMNGVAIALDISAFGPVDVFQAEVDTLAETIAVQATDRETERLLLPGQRGDAELARRQRDGIPLPKGVWNGLETAAKAAGLLMPETLT